MIMNVKGVLVIPMPLVPTLMGASTALAWTTLKEMGIFVPLFARMVSSLMAVFAVSG